MEEQQKELSKILGITKGLNNISASWAEIYTEIGRLKERAEKPPEIRYMPNNEPMPLVGGGFGTHPPCHYHGETIFSL